MSASGRPSDAPVLSLGSQCFEHPLRNVDALTAIDRFLNDQIELFRFGDLLDDPVRALEQRLQLLVPSEVQIFAIRALQPLKIERYARELLLFRTAIAFAHRHRLLFELRLQGLDL